jgi:hypothetical protein
MKFQLLHRAVKGTQVVSLNTATRAVHIRLLARQIPNARILPTAAASRPLAFAALSPSQPCSSPAPPLPVWRRWRGRGYWRADVRKANLKTVDADPSTSSRPRRQADRPPQATSRCGSGPSNIMRTTTSFATEVSPTWTPNALSLNGHQNRSAIYSCQCGLISETCLDSSFLIDWLWFWLMDVVAPSLCE